MTDINRSDLTRRGWHDHRIRAKPNTNDHSNRRRHPSRLDSAFATTPEVNDKAAERRLLIGLRSGNNIGADGLAALFFFRRLIVLAGLLCFFALDGCRSQRSELRRQRPEAQETRFPLVGSRLGVAGLMLGSAESSLGSAGTPLGVAGRLLGLAGTMLGVAGTLLRVAGRLLGSAGSMLGIAGRTLAVAGQSSAIC